MRGWDYGWPGSYFITICTKDGMPYFGEIIKHDMSLSHVGVIADLLWHELRNRHENLELGPYVIMPDHLHGIITITGTKPSLINTEVSVEKSRKKRSGTISSIVGGYKSAVTKHARRRGFEMVWQRRFYDVVIRDKVALERVEKYIQENVSNWNP